MARREKDEDTFERTSTTFPGITEAQDDGIKENDAADESQENEKDRNGSRCISQE